MKMFKVILIIILFFLNISAKKPECHKFKLISATVQKTIPGHRGADIKEKYIFICKKSKSSDITITKLWKGNDKKGRFIDYKIMKFDGKKIIYEEISSLIGVKIFAIVGTYKYPVDIANKPVSKSNDLCPIEDFNGKAIIEYSKKSRKKHITISEIEVLETIRRH